ncbi:MAG TPA: HNH endonuclease signature motif containing protein, partial [Gammaproteobacteria bacterium]|nr:HNH endonuclease signature motif containing protein [Gammaproteobacteria bacterium]
MRAVAPGDLVLSFEGACIRAAGVICSFAYECPKPPEFGDAGPNWERIGWKVDVRWFQLVNQIRPSDYIDKLRPHLPDKYSPLQRDGRGLQGIYLTAVPAPLMSAISDIVGRELRDLLHANRQLDDVGSYGRGLLDWEEHLRRQVEEDPSLDETTKQQIVLARRGQGRFKENVQRIEHACRITGVDRPEHLRASHIKPWRDAKDNERL